MAAFPTMPPLAITLLLGSAVVAPSLMAFVFANHSNRGDFLVRPRSVGRADPPARAARRRHRDRGERPPDPGRILTLVIMRQTLVHQLRHVLALIAVMAAIMLGGWGLGRAIHAIVPGTRLLPFLGECAIWLLVVAIAASPLLSERVRGRVLAAVPN